MSTTDQGQPEPRWPTQPTEVKTLTRLQLGQGSAEIQLVVAEIPPLLIKTWPRSEALKVAGDMHSQTEPSTSSLPVPSSRTGSVWPGWFWVGLTEQQADEPKLHDVRMSTKHWCDQPKVRLHHFLSVPSLHRGCSQNQRFGFEPLHSLPVVINLLQLYCRYSADLIYDFH